MEFSMSDHDKVERDAIDWLIRLRGGTVDDWDAFTLWLEADPAHVVAYDTVALADQDIGAELIAAPAVPNAANDDMPVARGSLWARTARFAALAATLVAAIFLYTLYPQDQRYQLSTAPGEHRVVTLGDGTRIALNANTRMTFDRRDTRFAKLDAGEALFTVRHDAANPFELVAGAYRIRDVGTVFNVVRESEAVQVAVAEGSVLFDPAGAAVALGAGQQLDARAGQSVRVSDTPAAGVGSWQDGRLVYTDAPLSAIAADLSRNLGVPVTVDAAVANQQFTGVIQIEPDTKALFARLAALWDVDARHTSHGWRISAHKRAAA
jgi:transmembrane sensor